MMYGILFFLATVTLIIGAKKIVSNMPNFKHKYVKNRWLWGIASMLFLALGILVVPEKVAPIRTVLIAFAIFDAMVFFEMTRIAIEQAMAIHDAINEKKLVAIRETKNGK
ncbi:hypothetical protein GYN16_10020 [Lactococcus piscium]|nr:hypothetical protein [Lactococcus sp.]MCJ1972143.1 hypothetical protein [Lactococcus carnosus]